MNAASMFAARFPSSWAGGVPEVDMSLDSVVTLVDELRRYQLLDRVQLEELDGSFQTLFPNPDCACAGTGAARMVEGLPDQASPARQRIRVNFGSICHPAISSAKAAWARC